MEKRDWKPGDTCVMFTNKAKGYTAEFTIEDFDGRYYGIRRGPYRHNVSPSRIFPTREDALASLEPQEPEKTTEPAVPTDEETDEEISEGIQMGVM